MLDAAHRGLGWTIGLRGTTWRPSSAPSRVFAAALCATVILFTYRNISEHRKVLQLEMLDIVKAVRALTLGVFGSYGIGAETRGNEDTRRESIRRWQPISAGMAPVWPSTFTRRPIWRAAAKR